MFIYPISNDSEYSYSLSRKGNRYRPQTSQPKERLYHTQNIASQLRGTRASQHVYTFLTLSHHPQTKFSVSNSLSGVPSSGRLSVSDTGAIGISTEERTRVCSVKQLVGSSSILECEHISLTNVRIVVSPLTALVNAREFLRRQGGVVPFPIAAFRDVVVDRSGAAPHFDYLTITVVDGRLIEKKTTHASASVNEFWKIRLLVVDGCVVTLLEFSGMPREVASSFDGGTDQLPISGMGFGMLYLTVSQHIGQTLDRHTLALPGVSNGPRRFGAIIRARVYETRRIMGALPKVCDRVDGVRGGVCALPPKAQDRIGNLISTSKS